MYNLLQRLYLLWTVSVSLKLLACEEGECVRTDIGIILLPAVDVSLFSETYSVFM